MPEHLVALQHIPTRDARRGERSRIALPIFPERTNGQSRHERGAIRPQDHADDPPHGNSFMAVRRLFVVLALLCGLAAGIAASSAENRAIVLASTTSTQDSGLLDYLLPIFTAKSGIAV